MAPKPADRVRQIPFSVIREVFEEVHRLEAGGRRIINLGIGRPDFDTPVPIKAAAKAALDNGEVHYTSNWGLPELRSAIARDLHRHNGLAVSGEDVLVTLGANEAVFLTMAALLDPGDEVLIPEPAWPHYVYCAQIVGARPVAVQGRAEDHFWPDPDELARHITPRTRLLVLNTPHNPTGTVIPADRLAAIAALARRHDLAVLSDEIYGKLVYDGAVHVSPGQLPDMAGRTVTVGSFSKAYAMDGWRVGFVTAPQELLQGMLKVHQYTVTCAPAMLQRAAVQALDGDQSDVAAFRQEFDRRRRLVVDRLSAIPGLRLVEPRGAFYVFVDITGTGLSSEQACRFFLEQAGVALVPGNAFGAAGEGYLRLAYSNTYTNLELALDAMAATLAARAV